MKVNAPNENISLLSNDGSGPFIKSQKAFLVHSLLLGNDSTKQWWCLEIFLKFSCKAAQQSFQVEELNLK